jgi:HSP20 family protein
MLMRWDPFGELDRLVNGAQAGWRRAAVPMDAYKRGDRFFVHLDLPGVDPDSIDLTVERNVLTVKAERRTLLDEYDEAIVTERPTGTFTRQLFLGENLDTNGLEAAYDSGVLTLTIPVTEAARPRKIEIQASQGSKAISAGATS